MINYLDGLWAITDIIPRTNHKPTVRRLVVPGHERDEKRRRDLLRKRDMNFLRSSAHFPIPHQNPHRRRSIPMNSYYMGQFWYQ